MNAQQHLAHLVMLMQPPYTNGWWAYVRDKAEKLAAQSPEYAELPALVLAERARIKAEALASRSASESSASTESPLKQSKPQPRAKP